MPRRTKRRADTYKTDEERQQARREQARERKALERQAKPKKRRTFQNDAERIQAKKEGVKIRVEKHRGTKEPWAPQFVGIDGESFLTDEKLPDGTYKQKYCLLLRNDREPLINTDGISTWEGLTYLTHNVPRKTALVGYFLNFDFEQILLSDLTDDEYTALQHGEEVSLYDGYYLVQWFVGKKLVIKRIKPNALRKPPEERKNKDYKMTTIQDVQGFFQSSFVSALNKWGFKDDERLNIITQGKSARGGFELSDMDAISLYNKTEMILLEELMLKVYDSFKAAYEKAGLDFKVHAGSWSGAGVFANDFLKQTKWVEEHFIPNDIDRDAYREGKDFEYGNEAAKNYPFSLAYYGGRIELAAVGRFGKGKNNDVNSGYPYALSLLPSWNPEDFLIYRDIGFCDEPKAANFLKRRLMGMYKIRFSFPEGWTWYPFPIRDKNGGSLNVFYPRQGTTHIMSPELFAALDTLPEKEKENIEILDAFVLEPSEGYGDAITRMDESRLCTTARKTLEMAAVRLDCKAASKRLGTPEEKEDDAVLAMAEKALKLILNSLYGKTVQQVGSHKYYSDFASAWITSTCRALLWRAIAPERKTDNVIMLMTDGIYSKVRLDYTASRITKNLGDWEENDFDSLETFKPGIYRYTDGDGTHYKVRGFLTPILDDKERLFAAIQDNLKTGRVNQFPSQSFITRNISKTGWKREPWRCQFKIDNKEIKSDLSAKRHIGENGWTLEKGQENTFFPPKRSHAINHSIGYALDFDTPELLTEENDEIIDDFLKDYDERIGLEEYYEPIS